MLQQLTTTLGDLVARYGFGRILLAIVVAMFMVAAAGMCIAGLLALRSMDGEERSFPVRAAGPKPRRVG